MKSTPESFTATEPKGETMGKLAAASAPTRPPKRCVVMRWVEENLDDEDLAAIESWFAAGFSIDTVHEHVHAVFGEPPPFSSSSLTGHRAGRCACEAPQPLQLGPARG